MSQSNFNLKYMRDTNNREQLYRLYMPLIEQCSVTTSPYMLILFFRNLSSMNNDIHIYFGGQPCNGMPQRKYDRDMSNTSMRHARIDVKTRQLQCPKMLLQSQVLVPHLEFKCLNALECVKREFLCMHCKFLSSLGSKSI